MLAQVDVSKLPPLHGTTVLATLDGVTTVLTAFLFVCLIFPSIVKNRPQYYAALACVVGIILLHTLTLALSGNDSLIVPAGVFTGLLQVGALILLVLSVGGLSVRELAGDMARAYEVIRRGETTKEVIIPIGDQASRPRRRSGTTTSAAINDDEPRTVYHIDTEPSSPAEEDPDKGIPLD